MAQQRSMLDNNSLWFKDAIIYQLHIKSFFDSNDDGVGDIKGLIEKLDYLKNLGINAVWLLPFYPSPLKDDGYDIVDYYDVNPQYGSLKDFKELLRQAHARGIRVITELVINHTSDQHPWFERARKSKPGSNYRNYYVWSNKLDKYKDARIIFKDFELSNWAWDEEVKAYYWHRFYSHQPDLNFDNPNVQKEIFKILDFWFGMGVDGLRLDAVPYLFEREGTNCENLPETYAFLKKLRKRVDSKFKNRMLLAEANQWPEDAVAYFGKGDECHMAFHFPLMPRMYMSVQMEDRFPIIDILEQTPAIPPTCQWATFLRNHDELTLEMVTDEERDYMYRSFAKDVRSKINLGIRRRLLPLLRNNRRKLELMNILLFCLPGTPIIYYGDEIGMGDNHFLGDRDGVRTPMQWSPDRNAGFSRANPQQLYLPIIIDSGSHYQSVNVETEEGNLSSLLWWMKRVIAMRKNFKAFSQGDIKFLLPDNPKVLCFTRQYEDEIILVVINLSRFAQVVELDLKEYAGYVPQEVFSQNEFPPIRETPYVITMGWHNHFWFSLKKKDAPSQETVSKSPVVKLESAWDEVFTAKHIRRIETSILPQYLMKCRWFGGKSKSMLRVKVDGAIPIAHKQRKIYLSIIQVQYSSGIPENYCLPLAFVFASEDKGIAGNHPESIICRLKVGKREGYLCDGIYVKDLHKILMDVIANKKKIKNDSTEIVGVRGKNFKTILGPHGLPMTSNVLKAEQSNSSILYENVFFMKLFRRLEEGKNPDVEIIQYLTDVKRFAHVPPFAGSIEIRRRGVEPMTLCLMQSCVPNRSEAWTYTLDQIKNYFDLILTKLKDMQEGKTEESILDPEGKGVNKEKMAGFIDTFYLEMVKLLGKRTGEMHLMLADGDDHKDFKPEAFSLLYQRSVYQSMSSQARLVFRLLKNQIQKLPVEVQGEATPVLALENEIYSRFQGITKSKISAKKIRIHGDYHLGQVLFTGKDFIVIDFEGEPARSLSERLLKRSALRDIAGMVRSFHYAAFATLFLNKSVREVDITILEEAADVWYSKVTEVFLNSYFDTIGKTEFLPKAKSELQSLFQMYLLDKAIYELGYELNNRPNWLVVPLRGIRNALNSLK